MEISTGILFTSLHENLSEPQQLLGVVKIRIGGVEVEAKKISCQVVPNKDGEKIYAFYVTTDENYKKGKRV